MEDRERERMFVSQCLCERDREGSERETKREREGGREGERDKERERGRESEREMRVRESVHVQVGRGLQGTWCHFRYLPRQQEDTDLLNIREHL